MEVDGANPEPRDKWGRPDLEKLVDLAERVENAEASSGATKPYQKTAHQVAQAMDALQEVLGKIAAEPESRFQRAEQCRELRNQAESALDDLIAWSDPC